LKSGGLSGTINKRFFAICIRPNKSRFSLVTWGFFRAPLRHANYRLVALTVPVLETADYIAKFLRHPQFNTRAKRNGKVIKVSTKSINFWAIGRQQHGTVRW